MKHDLETTIETAARELFDTDISVALTHPEVQFGDYATNVSLQLARTVGQPPRAIAEALAARLREVAPDHIREVTIAGPGFINVTLTDAALGRSLAVRATKSWAGKVVVAEYSDPNPFKVLHAGHLYTSIVGDSIANLLEHAGATVHRVNFGGDVGLHVAKTMWAILQKLGGEHPEKLAAIAPNERSEWMAEAYVAGTLAYEDDAGAKARIIELNRQVYAIQTEQDHVAPLAQIYWLCRGWSYDYFDAFYERIGTKFEKYYPESETAPIGLKIVSEQLARGVYEQSDGAVIFDGDKYGLHKRVFINSQGLPTYEAKDVGLIMLKWADYHFDSSVIITGNDIIEYMKVVLKSVEQFMPQLPARTTHLTHGIVKLAGGTKMSSRKGNILRAVDVLEAAAAANKAVTATEDERVTLGAVKYAFLKQRTGGDIIYSPTESVSLEGNSGPYLQYAHARARSILRKAGREVAGDPSALDVDLEDDERTFVRKMGEYSEVIDKAVADLLPHVVCTYLYELAQTFNRFYENNRVIDDPRQALRLGLVEAYAARLREGLGLLGMYAPEKM
ncbi:MAG: arginine--tRNA ligase [Candidatus Saccharibacteria bacterium]